jgi:hypothetical protein
MPKRPKERTIPVNLRATADSAIWWRQHDWKDKTERRRAFRVATHLLKSQFDKGKKLEDLEREYQ